MFLFFFLQGCFWTKTDVIPSENDTETLSQLEDDLPEVGVQIETSGPITCENPHLRNQEAMYLADFGETWSTQPIEGYSPPPDFMSGGEGIAVGDFTQDERLDIFVPTTDKDLFFIQQSDGSFTESSNELLPSQESSISCLFTSSKPS